MDGVGGLFLGMPVSRFTGLADFGHMASPVAQMAH